jgi:hypothetical protein
VWKDLAMTISCPICSDECHGAFEVKIQNSFNTQLFTCSNCGFSFYPNQNWISGSFSEELNSLDVGSVGRALLASDFLTEFIHSEKLTKSNFLDYGGGYGLQTRILRDRGLNWKNFDPFAQPLFSRNFTGDLSETYQLISLIEVSLHFENPIHEFAKLTAVGDYLVFTAVIPGKDFGPGWWYITGETGQHIAFYSLDSLKEIARQLGVLFSSDGKFFHVFHKAPLKIKTKILLRSRVLMFMFATFRYGGSYLMRAIGRSKSLLLQDQDLAKEILEQKSQE